MYTSQQLKIFLSQKQKTGVFLMVYHMPWHMKRSEVTCNHLAPLLRFVTFRTSKWVPTTSHEPQPISRSPPFVRNAKFLGVPNFSLGSEFYRMRISQSLLEAPNFAVILNYYSSLLYFRPEMMQ